MRRRERNIERALDAVLELISEGVTEPTFEAVARRSGVSHRSLYRYFADRRSLMRAAIDRSRGRIGPLLDIDEPGEGSLDERIVAFVRARTDTYREFAPVARTSFYGSREEAAIVAIDGIRAVLCGQLVTQFAPELDLLNRAERRRTVALLDVAFQFEALEYLVNNAGLSASELVGVLEAHLRAHLAPLRDRFELDD